jgi:hypothetical protein
MVFAVDVGGPLYYLCYSGYGRNTGGTCLQILWSPAEDEVMPAGNIGILKCIQLMGHVRHP